MRPHTVPARRAAALCTAAAATLILGYVDLVTGGLTVGPILLVVGYLVVVPIALVKG